MNAQSQYNLVSAKRDICTVGMDSEKGVKKQNQLYILPLLPNELINTRYINPVWGEGVGRQQKYLFYLA